MTKCECVQREDVPRTGVRRLNRQGAQRKSSGKVRESAQKKNVTRDGTHGMKRASARSTETLRQSMVLCICVCVCVCACVRACACIASL